MVLDRARATTTGTQVLALEAAAIRRLFQRLGGSVGGSEDQAEVRSEEPDPLAAAFSEACERILACTGRVVVTGMGKAGLIGQKISATLASTGTPSLSLHPAEALHGDLGRVRAEDLLLALSKSGTTRELVALLPSVKALGATVIAMTETGGSPLGVHADLVLELGALDEACPLGLAPTVTTTAMLALGDALAMAVLEGREFTREEFAAFHPAGSLGRDLVKVGEIMRRDRELPLIESGSTVRQTLVVMTETPGRPGAALVVDAQGRLAGIFTDGDLRRLCKAGSALPFDDQVDAHMVAEPRVLHPDQLVGAALHQFKDAHVDQMPVVDPAHGTVVGLVDVQDLLEIRL